MPASVPFGRFLSRRIAPRNLHIVTRFGTRTTLSRVTCTCTEQKGVGSQYQYWQDGVKFPRGSRNYATASASRPAGRPKAHTGRATAKRTPARSGTAKKPATKKSAGKKKPARKTKAKAKPKPKRAAKKAPSAAALRRTAAAKTRDLKAKALLDPPKKLPATAWALIFTEAHPKGVSIQEGLGATKDAAAKFRGLSPEERERYNHTANANKEKNEIAHKQWLSKFSPEEIRQANLARRQLAKLDKAKHPNKKQRSSKFAPLKDERTVKNPRNAFTYFSVDRRKSGDFSGMSIVEASRLIGREWKEASAAEKQQFQSQATADRNRYITEYKTVYGRDPKTATTSKKTS